MKGSAKPLVPSPIARLSARRWQCQRPFPLLLRLEQTSKSKSATLQRSPKFCGCAGAASPLARTSIFTKKTTSCARSLSASSTSALRQLPSGLQQLGLEPGETVAIMLPTCADFFYTFAGILLAGGIPVPIYPPFRADRIAEYATRQSSILRNAEARFLITFRQAEGLARLLQPRVPTLREVLNPQRLASAAPELLRRPPPRWRPVENLSHHARSEDIAFLQYTSGSTGDPKGVTLTHANLLANIHSIVARVDLQPEDVARKLAAAVSRHGTDRRVVRAALFRYPAGGDVAARVFEPAGALAPGDSSASRDDKPGAEFCLRAVRAENRGQGFAGTRSELLARGAQWRRAGPRRHDSKNLRPDLLRMASAAKRFCRCTDWPKRRWPFRCRRSGRDTKWTASCATRLNPTAARSRLARPMPAPLEFVNAGQAAAEC